MTYSDADEANLFIGLTRDIPNSRRSERIMRTKPGPKPRPTQPLSSRSFLGSTETSTTEGEVSTAISWPIVLAVIPMLGAFVAGSAEVWGDFVMGLLILYYVYKWVTVPWSCFEDARARRIIHQNAASRQKDKRERHRMMAKQLRKDERVGLMWLLVSPFIVVYSLRFVCYYFLSDDERYLNYFNVTVFILGALIRPLEYVVTMLIERALALQHEAAYAGTSCTMDLLQARIARVTKEISELYTGLITKEELCKITKDISPALGALVSTTERIEEKEKSFKEWSEERFASLERRFSSLDRMILYMIEQDQERSTRQPLFALTFLPVNIAVWLMQWLAHWVRSPNKNPERSALPATAPVSAADHRPGHQRPSRPHWS